MKWNYFSTGLNEVDLMNLKMSSEAELNGIVEGNRKSYEERLKDRLSCNICYEYDITEFGGIPISTPFQCLHYFHPLCCPNKCFVCGRNIPDQYTDLYH